MGCKAGVIDGETSEGAMTRQTAPVVNQMMTPKITQAETTGRELNPHFLAHAGRAVSNWPVGNPLIRAEH